MANRLQLKRGSGTPGSVFYEGEPMYDLTGEVLFVGDSGSDGTGTGSSIASNIAYETVLEMLSRADAAGPGELKLYEDTDNGTNLITLSGPAALDADYTITLPTAGPASADQILKTDGSGNLSFVNFLTIAADTGTADPIIPADTITFAGTANEIETAVSDGQIQIGLPDNVIVGGALTVTNITVSGTTTLNGAVDLGDDVEDLISIIGSIDTNIIPTGTVNLGATASRWDNLWANAVTVDNIQIGVNGTGEIDTDSGNLTLDSAGGTVTIDDDATVTGSLTVNGDLRVVGTAVTFETETVRVEDRVIELGLVDGAEPTTTTTWDSGVAFNYFQTSAKKSGVVWLNNTFMAMLSELSESADTGNADPQITATAYAPVAAGGLYIGGIAAGNEVINSTQEAVNLIFDGGSY